MFAVGQRREPLNMHAEQIREHLSFRLAELCILARGVLDRTVPLAQLHADLGCSVTHRPGAGRIPLSGEYLSERRHLRVEVIAGSRDRRGCDDRKIGCPLCSKRAHRSRAAATIQEIERRDGELVVGAA